MRNYVNDFYLQIQDAIKISNVSIFPKQTPHRIQQIVLCGLGGSGIAGQVIAKLVGTQINVPVLFNNDYHIPTFVNEHTLVIVSSYSGNTEEVLSCLTEAQNSKAIIACITSGGAIKSEAEKNNYPCVSIPGGHPPRTCFAYSLIAQYTLFQYFGLINDAWKFQAANAAQFIQDQKDAIIKEATQIANKLSEKITVVYAASRYNSVATRFCQQIAENAKQLCWNNEFPEMNHNEIVGWTKNQEQISVVFLHFSKDGERIHKRMDLTKKIINNYASNVLEIKSKGQSELEEVLYMVHLTDWVSVLIAEILKVDPVEIKVIDQLKAALSKL